MSFEHGELARRKMFSHRLYDHMLVSVHVAGLPCTCAVMLFTLHVLVRDWSRQMSI